jgi:hypothetical protein
MKTIKWYFTLSKRAAVILVLAALCALTLSGCDNLYDALKFGDRDAEAQDDLVGGNRVIIRVVDLDSFGITVDDGALSPALTEVLEDATQFTMQSDGTVRFQSGSIEVQENDIVIVRGSSQTGTVTIIRPSSAPPTTP